MTDYLLKLHDDAIINIGEYVGKLYGPEAYTKLGQTCKRIRKLLLPEDDSSAQTEQNIIGSRLTHQPNVPLEITRGLSITSLKELAVFEAWCETPLHKDNRIPFPFASVEVDESMHDKIYQTMKIMERYHFLSIHLDSHCGTIAPNSVAHSFSRSRGEAIKDVLYDSSRVEVIGWGKRISNKVARSDDHPFGDLARQGRGWVEIYVVLSDGVMLPPRHEFYNTNSEQTEDDDVDLNAVLNGFLDVIFAA